MSTTFGNLIERFAQRRVLVLGDMVADEYLIGTPSRISREAPVLILHHAGSFIRPGGATNAAYNLSGLRAGTRVIGVIGDDEMGTRLKAALATAGIDDSGLLVDSARPTTTSTRVVARGTQGVQQQIVRIDRLESKPVPGSLRDAMIEATCRLMQEVDVLLISDYTHGVISPELIDACIPVARARGVKIVVDSHGDLFRFRGVTAATPNQPEAEAATRIQIENDEDLDEAGVRILAGMEAEAVLITRGNDGLVLYERDLSPYRLPVSVSQPWEIVDPTGAGDTVAAVFALAISSGASMRQAAFLGNVAGGEVVRRLGAATLSPPELVAAVEQCALPAPEN